LDCVKLVFSLSDVQLWLVCLLQRDL